jgi:hypothetical protein
MGLHDPFEHLKHKLWPKEKPRVKLLIWLPTTKSQESPWFPCVQVACHILLERFQWRLQFCFRPHFNRRFTHKIMGLQSCKSPNFENFGIQLGSPKTKWHLGDGLVARHREQYKGGRWWLLPSLGRGESCEFVFARGLSMHQKCSNYILTNLLFGLCRSMWIIELLVTLPSPHLIILARRSTPKCRKPGSVPQLFILSLFSP